MLFEPTVPGCRGREPLLNKHFRIGHRLPDGLNVSVLIPSALFGRSMPPVVSLRHGPGVRPKRRCYATHLDNVITRIAKKHSNQST